MAALYIPFTQFWRWSAPTPWFVSHETLLSYIYFMNTQIRKSYTELNKIYFWTATIHDWLHLLEPEENKKVIISSLKKQRLNYIPVRTGFIRAGTSIP